MVLRTSISFEKPEFGQEEAIRGHIDVDIDQFQAPADGHKDDYLCKFKVYGLFSFQQPDFRKSTLPKWKRGRDAIASWQTSIVDGTTCEFTVNSKDCPFLLKPGSATRVRSIPFSFHMCRLGLPASFTSTRGRAKLEYIVSTTTTGKRARDTNSASFVLLPYLAIRTFETHQYNFNVDIENGGATTALAANVRNIITVSYPARLLQGSLQNVAVTFPDDRFILQDVSMTVTSKLLVQALKSSFAIEEDTDDIPCVITEDSTPSKVLSIRVPPDLRESFNLTLKKSTVKKVEMFQLLFSYGVQISEDNILYCTSSCEVPIVVVGVHPSELSTEINGAPGSPSTVSREIPQVVEAPASDVIHLTKPISNGIAPNTLQTNKNPSNSLQLPDETVKQSAVKALRGILKKPKRRSKEDSKLLEVPKPVTPCASPEPSATSSLVGGVVPEISSKHSDDESPMDMEELGGLRSRAPVPVSPEEKRLSRGIQRGSLQLAAFDRTLFAIRGAELRDEYMRDSRRAAAEVEL